MALTRDHARMEKQRVQAAAMFEKGISAPEVGGGWGEPSGGLPLEVGVGEGRQGWLGQQGKAGRKSKLTAEQTDVVVKALVAGPVSRGYKTNLWTLPRVAALIRTRTGVEYHPGHVWRLLGDNGFSCQRPERRAIERDEPKIPPLEAGRVACDKKNRQRGPNPSSSSTKAD